VSTTIGPVGARPACGGTCACRRSVVPPSGTTLLLASATGHTTRLARRVAEQHGYRARDRAGLLDVTGGPLEPLILHLDAALTATEAGEMRICVDPPTDDAGAAMAEAFAAPTVAVAAARIRHREVVGLLADQRAFFSRYQPIVRLADGEVVAHEALLRARLDGRVVTPDVLFGAAEAAGAVHALDRVGRETAIGGAGGWLGDHALFVNFIPTSIYRPELCLRTTERAATEAGIPMEQLVFEVTESHRVDDVGHLRRIFEHYRAKGCRVALDDLGAGYSSLNLLAELRPDVVKIDMALVQGLPDAAPTAVIRAVTDMSHELGATVVAEGIETAEQAALVADLGADLGQGWYFGRPVERTPG
jgi:EAL domain-containing protein (putative c-di-GMP-specific phosphodiesterase class I)